MARIETTHVGSLPRSQAVADLLFAREKGEAYDAALYERTMAEETRAVVRRQRETGIDRPSDGETSKISYATYIKDRLTGFDGDSPRRPPADLALFPAYMASLSKAGGTPTYRRPRCVGPIHVKTLEPLEIDLANFQAGLDEAGYGAGAGFMNSASPGVIALFQPSDHHANDDDYMEDVAEAMRAEYERIVAAGLDLQIDAPDLGLGRHMMYRELDDAGFVARAERHVEILNRALRNVPGDRVRMHVCWGNYEGPHVCDVAMRTILPVLLKAKPRKLLFEASNPRHAHEWRVWTEAKIPDDYVLIPGCLDSTTNFVEHPELVAERIERFAGIVGPERVIAGTDCGFGTFAGFGAVHADIAWAKLASLVEGAQIASRRLTGRAAA